MANFFYVKQGLGTRTTGGGDGVARTGTFASMAAGDVYATIEAALNDGSTPPIAGDFIYASSDHSYSAASSRAYGLVTAFPVPVISVNDSNADEFLAGASEAATAASSDIGIAGTSAIQKFIGLTLTADDNIQVIGVGCAGFFEDCILTMTGAGDQLFISSDGAYMEIRDSTVTWSAGSTSQMLTISAGDEILCDNVQFFNGSGTLDDFARGSIGSGGATIRLNSCDCSEIEGWMLGQNGSSADNDDNFLFTMQGCKMPASKQFAEEEFASPGHFFLATNCSDVAAEAEYQFFQRTWTGDVEDSGDDGSGIYRDESDAFENGNKVSFRIITTSNASQGAPLAFDMIARFADLTNAASDTITIYFAVPDTITLTDTNFWASISYPDVVNSQTWKTTSNRNTDIIAPGTTHTDDSGSSTWKEGASDLIGYNEYRMTITSSSGAASLPRIQVFCTVPDITMYVDTTVDLS